MLFKIKIIACLSLTILFSTSIFAQTLPSDKITDWSKAGLLSAIPDFDTINVLYEGLMPDGSASSNAALKNLLTAHSGSPTVFYFPPGNYFFDETIELNNNQVMKGASADETIFTFDLNGQNDLIVAKGTLGTLSTNINANATAGQNTLSVVNADGFKIGDFIRIQFDDALLITSPWAEKSTGQILKILNINGHLITVSNLLRRNINLSENPYIEKLNPVQFAGVECLHIERQDETVTQTSNIFLQFAANCWVKGISSHNANFAHIDIENGAHNHVTGCYFNDAFAYGGGGQGYGIVLEFNTSDCLIDNNIFDHLRHSMLLQAGANGNVLSYNYSIDPYWDEVGLPDDAAGDLVLHGNYPYLNLFEGNIAQNIVIDDSHGINGPGNIFLRNRAEHYGIFMNDDVPTNDQAFIGNEITSSNFLLGFYELAGADHFEYGNNVKGTIIPAGTDADFYPTLYLQNDVPDYFSEYELNIASIGLPNNLNSGVNPAYKRFAEGQLTLCEIEDDEVVIDHIENKSAEFFWDIFPNPTRNLIHIESELPINDYSVRLTDLNGKTILFQEMATPTIDISDLHTGLYILILENGIDRFYQKINVVK